MASRNEGLSLAHHAKEAHDRAQDVSDSLATASASGAPLAPSGGGFGAGATMAAEAYAIALVLQTVIVVRDMLVNAKTNVRAPHAAPGVSVSAAALPWPRVRRARWRSWRRVAASATRGPDPGVGAWHPCCWDAPAPARG
jgi:hypothetical protein